MKNKPNKNVRTYYQCTCYGHGLLIEKDEDNLFWIMKACLGTRGETLPLKLRIQMAWKMLTNHRDVGFEEVVFDKDTAYRLGCDIVQNCLERGEAVSICNMNKDE